jgi:hypothetical protein
MSSVRLRVYYGPESDPTPAASRDDQVTLSLGELAPLLVDAIQSRRTWLRDFELDDITISTDLYQVLLAYQHHRRPGA